MNRTPIRFPLIGFLLLLACALVLPGCALVPGYENAKASYEASQAQFAKTVDALQAASEELIDLKQQYDAAVASGDTTKAGALLMAAQTAATKYQTLKAAADESRASYEVAAAQLKKAETGVGYVGTVLGLLGAAFTAFLGFKGGAAKPTAAVGVLANTIEDLKDGKKWDEIKTGLATKLAAAKALTLVEKVRP